MVLKEIESLKNGTNELIYNKEIVINAESKFMVTKGKGERGINWKTGIDTYTLLYTKEITNKNCTENSTQYSVMT